MNKNVSIINHPVAQHKLSYLRDKNTTSQEFRNLTSELSRLVAYEATADLESTTKEIETPIEKTNANFVKESPIVVSIMRAGNQMLDAILTMLPFASAGHIGIYRDKLIKSTVEYYFRLPKNEKGKKVLLCDPMVATGDTVLAAVDRLKQYEVGEIKLLCLLISKSALDRLNDIYPDVKVYCTGVEERMGETGYLIPGMGDAGKRLYGSE